VSVDYGVSSATGVAVPVGDALIEGDLVLPEHASGIVLFAHGSGSSRHSPRNREVAAALNRVGIGTLLLDLLTLSEDRADRLTGQYRFNIDLLARRLIVTVDWLRQGPAAAHPIGLFGASTGAAAALVAAAARPYEISAVVSRGGRPDLAGSALRQVRAPTLLIVGSADPQVLELNRRALEEIGAADKQLEVVPGATHLFEEAGALERVAQLAAAWFLRHFGGESRPGAGPSDVASPRWAE
jgi:dienelactone hydrolase